ncbi:MAG: molybdopterin-containing oxidoreductase family protein, partial [Thermodesulfobacteriota bacterium]
MKKVPVACGHNCGGGCSLIAHVEDGVVKRITSDESLPDEPGRAQLRACLKGRAYRQRLYHPDRLQHPLKRTGERGAGRFERVSWEEALDTIAGKMRELREKYGAETIMNVSHSGTSQCLYHRRSSLDHLLNRFGGQTSLGSCVSNDGAVFAGLYTYGTVFTGNEREDLLNAKMILMWGWNPADSIFGTNSSYYVALAREKGARVVAVDPRCTDSAAVLADQWVPIRPGTDTAMLIAMAYVMIEEDLHDQVFLDRFAVGFDRFKAYALGREDGVPKSPGWAEQITGVPADTTRELARAYATSRPAALVAGFGPCRTNHGEQFNRATATLCAMTGNVGVPGGSAGIEVFGYPVLGRVTQFPADPSPNNVPVHFNKWADAIIEGRAGGYPSDIKMVYSVAGNTANQLGNIRKADRALRMLYFMVVHDQFMTATARYADFVLPVTTQFERNDVFTPWFFGHYLLYSSQAIEPYGESRNDIDIFTELAVRLGIQGFNDLTEEDWLKKLTSNAGIGDWEAFKRHGAFRYELDKPYVAFQEQVEDPENHPFATSTGKIEIHSPSIESLGRPEVPPIPKYVAPRQNADEDPYPLHLVTGHSKKSSNSMFHRLPWIREVEAQELWINSMDAEARDIKNGDRVKVTSQVGATLLPARVTERIVPGTVNVDQGIEFELGPNDVEQRGCANA